MLNDQAKPTEFVKEHDLHWKKQQDTGTHQPLLNHNKEAVRSCIMLTNSNVTPS